jgi:predicted FMN-binding regulatory protein PaiB
LHVPPVYRPPDAAAIRELIRANPLAILVTAAPDASGPPQASHVPVILPSGDGPPDSDTLRVVGHMNRANPQWQAVLTGAPALVIFTGPHGYVSPSVYDYTPAAPTWNFSAVHLTGALAPIPRGEPTLRVIRDTVTALESRFGRQWDMNASAGYFDRLLPGVGAFRMRADTTQSMFKLSQEQQPGVRARVAATFAASDEGTHQRLAALMRRCQP